MKGFIKDESFLMQNIILGFELCAGQFNSLYSVAIVWSQTCHLLLMYVLKEGREGKAKRKPNTNFEGEKASQNTGPTK